MFPLPRFLTSTETVMVWLGHASIGFMNKFETAIEPGKAVGGGAAVGLGGEEGTEGVGGGGCGWEPKWLFSLKYAIEAPAAIKINTTIIAA